MIFLLLPIKNLGRPHSEGQRLAWQSRPFMSYNNYNPELSPFLCIFRADLACKMFVLQNKASEHLSIQFSNEPQMFKNCPAVSDWSLCLVSNDPLFQGRSHPRRFSSPFWSQCCLWFSLWSSLSLECPTPQLALLKFYRLFKVPSNSNKLEWVTLYIMSPNIGNFYCMTMAVCIIFPRTDTSSSLSELTL